MEIFNSRSFVPFARTFQIVSEFPSLSFIFLLTLQRYGSFSFRQYFSKLFSQKTAIYWCKSMIVCEHNVFFSTFKQFRAFPSLKESFVPFVKNIPSYLNKTSIDKDETWFRCGRNLTDKLSIHAESFSVYAENPSVYAESFSVCAENPSVYTESLSI